MSVVAGIEKVGDVWVVRVPGRTGRDQEFQCASEAMARRLAASMGRPAPPVKPVRLP